MTAPVRLKDPSAVIDEVIDWSDWLSDDTIASSTWEITGGADSPPALTVDSNDHDDTTTTAWLLGGEAGVDYLATNQIVTDSTPARTEQRSIRIHVREL